ncbi:MAG: vWA domain-containing protein [Planctomycetota bacterium]
MNDLLNSIFGLADGLGFGADGVQLGWDRPLPAYLWALVVVAAIALAAWSYTRLEAPSRARVALAGLRALVIVLLAVMLAGPRLERSRSSVERDWVVGVVDRSVSMTIPDAPDNLGTRESELQSALTTAAPTLDTLNSDKRLSWIGFDATTYDLASTQTGAPTLLDPAGRRTSINAALDGALRKVAAKPVSGVVLFSDGRAAEPPSRRILNRLQAEQVPVFVVPLGSPEPRTDWSVRAVRAPSVVFAEDVVPFRVQIDRLGGGGSPEGAIVELVEASTGLVLDRTEASDTGEALLSTKIDTAGERELIVRLADGGIPGDLIASNNAVAQTLEVVSGPIRVLYLDGAPRWEQRYLKGLLLREGSISSSSLILAAARRYQQEGDIIINTLPVSPEEWDRFDVVILGDMRGELLGVEQLETLKRHIADRGAGLLWLGGPSATPGSWRDTPMDDLLPMRVSAQGSGSNPSGLDLIDGDVTVRREIAAERLGLLELGEAGEQGSGEIWAGRVSDPRTGWSRLRWAQAIPPSTLKPAAETFASAIPVDGGPASPAVLSMRFGAGRVIYVATDEIWRWRYGRGEDLIERFWLPMLRLLARERVERAAQRAVLEVAPDEPVAGAPATVAVRLFDQALLDAAPASVTVIVESNDGTRETLELESGAADTIAGERGSAEYLATWFPQRPGSYALRADEPLLAGLGLELIATVVAADDELRQPETDHALLAELAEQTGGAVILPTALDTLPDLLPNRSRTIIAAPEIATLWDTPPFLIALVLLAGLEWIGRKIIRLS